MSVGEQNNEKTRNNNPQENVLENLSRYKKPPQKHDSIMHQKQNTQQSHTKHNTEKNTPKDTARKKHTKRHSTKKTHHSNNYGMRQGGARRGEARPSGPRATQAHTHSRTWTHTPVQASATRIEALLAPPCVPRP